MQGYYLSGSGQPLTQTSGMAESSSQFIEGLGLLKTNVEGYGGDGFQTGNVFAGLEGAPIWGWHWDFIGGDFHFSSNLVENPFSNVYIPEIAGRGGQVAMRRTNTTYRFFMGEDSVLGGPRIPFRLILPQLVTGAAVVQKVGDRWELGARYLNLKTSASALTSDSAYILPGRTYKGSNSVTFQSTFHISKDMKIYGETGYSAVSDFTPSPVGQKPFSFLVGPTWETQKFSVRANYVSQSTSYMPLLGYFAGDRKGPYVEGHYRPVMRMELYGSASAYSNNLEHNPTLPSFTSSGYTMGASFMLPWKLSAGGSVSALRLTEVDPSQPAMPPSNNRQINLNASRPFGHQNLRFSLIDMNLDVNGQPQTQRYEEIEDTFNWKLFMVGGATRLQNTQSATDDRNSVFYRGSLQANIKRVAVYGYMEKGDDLLNKSIFSTNSMSSTVLGLTTPLFKGWSLQLEAFQNRLLTALNPENIFLFGNGDQGLNTQLSNFNQRSIYFKIGKHYSWGKPMEQGGTIEQYAAAHAPLVGSVEGFVTEAARSGSRPAPNVTIILDHGRTATSDDTGHYAFSDVPEGVHELELNMEQLPADYAPGPDHVANVGVTPRALVRADFDVTRLANLSGKVIAPKGVQLDDVVVRIAGTNQYTTPYDDGTFSFYNLREGKYDVELDEATIPEGYVLGSAAHVTVSASDAESNTTIEFELKPKPQVEKPVRQMLNQQIHVNAPTKQGPH